MHLDIKVYTQTEKDELSQGTFDFYAAKFDPNTKLLRRSGYRDG